MACTGYIEPADPQTLGTGGSLVPGVDATGTPAAAAPSDAVVPAMEVACQGSAKIGASIMRRQTNAEYVRNARLLLNAASADVDIAMLPGEATVNNFENVAGLQSVSEQHVTAFDTVIKTLVAATLANPQARDGLIKCAPVAATRASCLGSFAKEFGRRAFRRPLSDAELAAVAELGNVAENDTDPYASVALIARGLITASSSLFLVEIGAPDPSAPNRSDYSLLSSYELAARAAFLAWGSGPDDWLLDRAGSTDLTTTDGRAVLADHLLADDRVRVGQRDFFYRWLRMRDVARAQRDVQKEPAWTDALKDSMIEETRRLVEDVAWTPGRDFREVLDAKYTFLDAPLATLYGLSAPGAAWAKVELPAGAHRVGILTQASLLTATGRIKAKAILRGKLIEEALLCQTLPSPPPDVPLLANAPVAADASDRERLTSHRSNPACAGCHKLLDAVGFGLENYDDLGRYTAADSSGHLVDARGALAGFEPEDFDGAPELAAKLKNSDAFSSCVSLQLFRWATARPNETEDDCAVAGLWNKFKSSGFDYRSMLSALITSDGFRHRNIKQP